MPEDLLQDMELDSGVGHPGSSGVTQAVAGQVGQADAGDDLVPVRRVANCRGGEDAAFRADQQLILGVFACGEAFEDGTERVEYWDAAFFAALGLLGDQAASAGVDLAGDDDEVLLESDVPDLEPGDLDMPWLL
jgi:hypothetical protein